MTTETVEQRDVEITTLWRFGQFHAEPAEYRVISRTRKTLKVQQVQQPHHTVPPSYINTVNLSALGVEEWFCSPRDAYAHEARRIERQIDTLKQRLQTQRSRLGQVESIIARIDRSMSSPDPSKAQQGSPT